jgi:hypothetical protein
VRRALRRTGLAVLISHMDLGERMDVSQRPSFMKHARVSPACVPVVSAALLCGLSLAACSNPPSATVPDVTGTYPSDAERRLGAAGLVSNYPSVPILSGAGCGSNGYAVAGQDPSAGATTGRGSIVRLTLVGSANGGGICAGEPARSNA